MSKFKLLISDIVRVTTPDGEVELFRPSDVFGTNLGEMVKNLKDILGEEGYASFKGFLITELGEINTKTWPHIQAVLAKIPATGTATVDAADYAIQVGFSSAVISTCWNELAENGAKLVENQADWASVMSAGADILIGDEPADPAAAAQALAEATGATVEEKPAKETPKAAAPTKEDAAPKAETAPPAAPEQPLATSEVAPVTGNNFFLDFINTLKTQRAAQKANAGVIAKMRAQQRQAAADFDALLLEYEQGSNIVNDAGDALITMLAEAAAGAGLQLPENVAPAATETVDAAAEVVESL